MMNVIVIFVTARRKQRIAVLFQIKCLLRRSKHVLKCTQEAILELFKYLCHGGLSEERWEDLVQNRVSGETRSPNPGRRDLQQCRKSGFLEEWLAQCCWALIHNSVLFPSFFFQLLFSFVILLSSH